MEKKQLIEAIFNPDDPQAQIKAAIQMRHYNDQQIKYTLFRACYEADNPKLRKAAVESLGVLSKENALNAFSKSIVSKNPKKRGLGYYHLGDLGDPIALNRIIHGFNDPDVNVRKAAIISAGKLGREQSTIDALKKLINSFEPEFIKKTALRSIENIQNRMPGFNKQTTQSFNNQECTKTGHAFNKRTKAAKKSEMFAPKVF